MAKILSPLEFLLQLDWRTERLAKLGTDYWTPVYLIQDTDDERLGMYSALIPNSRTKKVLTSTDWDISIGFGPPGFNMWWEQGKQKIRYDHFSLPGSIQPLVIVRDFHGVRPSYVEILEEFRLFHNLYHDATRNVYIKFSDNGDEDEVVRIQEKRVDIRLMEVRQFLAAKHMRLAIYFDIDRFSELALLEVPEDQHEIHHSEELLHYGFFVDDMPYTSNKNHQSFSRLHGKKLIKGVSIDRTNVWPFEEERKYEDFIIGSNTEGEPVVFSCNPEHLANYFGANPQNPHYLTPVFFRKDVLGKYYADPHRYEVGDGYIESKGYWRLRADTNHSKYVIVFLGDLGRDIPYNEQKIWRSYNIVPDGTLSQTAFKRGILGDFAEPDDPAHLLKSRYQTFQELWFKKHQWYLFKPLSPDDQYLFTGLRVPLTNGHSEFDSQVIALTKLLVDSLNEKKLAEGAVGLGPDDKGITKLVDQPAKDDGLR